MNLKRSLGLLSIILFIALTTTISSAEVRVLATSPVGRVEGRDATYTITVTFNQPMVPLQKLPEGDGTGPLRIEPGMKGKFRWQGTSVLSFTPEEPLPLATQFKVTLPKGTKSQISGEVLREDYTWHFETLRPDLLSSYPYERRDWIELDRPIFLLFNQPMSGQRAKYNIKIREIRPDGRESELDYQIRSRIERDTETLKGLQSEGESVYQIKTAPATHVLVLTPEYPLRRDCSYSIKLQKGLLAKEGNLGLIEDRTIHFKTYKTFRFIRPDSSWGNNSWDNSEPSSGLLIIFTNPVRFSDLLEALTIEPKVEFPEHYYRSENFSYPDYGRQCCPMRFYVELKPDTTYRVKIKGSLQDKYDQVLGDDIETELVTGDYAPRLSMPTGMGIIESYIEPVRHPVTILNLDRLRVQKARIKIDEIVKLGAGTFVDYDEPITPPGGYTIDTILEPKATRNKRRLVPIELKDILGESRYGIVYLQVAVGGQYRQAFLQVTSMGITGKFSPDGNLLYVSYLKTANPVKDCGIELRSNENKVLWRGRTDENGFVKTPSWEELKIIPRSKWENPQIWVIAKKDEDMAFIHSGWGMGIYSYQFNIPYEWYPEYPKYGGHIFTERGIYRPGEKVYIKGIVREKRFGRWAIPRITEYQLFIKDSRDSEVSRTRIKLSDLGSFDYTYNIDKNAVTGYYTIYLWQKDIVEKQGVAQEYADRDDSDDRMIRLSSQFRVEEYKPATFEVNVDYDKESYVLQDTARIKINGRYLFGAAMSEAETQYTVRLERSYFEPEDYQGYSFGGYFGDYPSCILSSAKTKLDKDGNLVFTCPIVSGSIGPFSLITEGLVTAPDRQRLSGRKATIVHPGEFYIGLKPKTTFIEKGKDIDLEIITVSPDGKILGDKELSCRLKRIEWNSARKAGVGGRLEWQTERVEVDVESFTIKSSLKPYKWVSTIDKAGYYIFTAEGKDSKKNRIVSSQYFYATGRDYIAWARDEDDRIELVSDKGRYKPGETAKILVKSPYERANAVVTLEREGVISQWRTEVIGSADTISVPIGVRHLPNIFVCVMLYQGRLGEAKFSLEGEDLARPSFKIGYININVDPQTRHLSVLVKQDKKLYRPGNRVKVDLKVTDSRGKGVSSEVTLAVVDLGILNLINYKTPNSFPYFYGPRPLSVQTAEGRLHLIGQRSYGEKGEESGGGGGILASGIDIRKRFLPTVYWNPRILTAKDGTAEVSFTLPDNLTTFRIMATAQTRDSSFGAGESRFVVNKPLVLKPSLPRFARLGDRFSAGVLCHNNTRRDGIVSIEVKTKGIRLLGTNRREISLKKGEAKEVRFGFLVERTGKAEFTFTGKMDNETDGLRWTIPLSIPRPSEAVATYSSTMDRSEEGIKIPQDIYDEASSINISVAPTALVGLKGGLEYLFEYPYGYLEQKTSKVLPLVLAGDLIDLFNLAPLKERTARVIITEYLSELPQFQTPSGGFAFWKGGIPSPYLTAYVLWLVAKAREAGYAVNEDMRIKAVEYLKGYIRGDKSGWDWPYNLNAKLCTKAFSIYSLSINGCHEQSYINNLYQRLGQMPLFGKVYLLKAIHNEKMPQMMIDTIVQDLSNKAKFSPTMIHFEESDDRGMEWIWHSNVRTTAAVLQALLEVNKGYPNAEKVARWLSSERKSGRWLTTQENIYVFYAFQEYVKRYEEEMPDFTARVLLEGKEIIKEVFKGRTLEARDTKLAVNPYKRDEVLPLCFEKVGTGRLYYDLRMIYAPKGVLEPRSEGIAIEKKVEPFKSGDIRGDNYSLSGRYRVTLKVKTDQERLFVVVDDPIPAGWEVVDLSLATESQEEAREFDRGERSYRWWGTFDHWENYDDRVVLFANYLERGEHTYSYLVQATTPGEFLIPATKAEEMYTPEVFGRSGQKRIKISE